MKRHIDVDRALEDWLAEGPSRLPDRAIDGIVRQLDETNQRRSTWLPGRERMNRMILAVGGVAAAVALTLIAAGMYLGLNPGAPGVGSEPSATASPSTPPTRLPWQGALEPGTYFVDKQPYRYTFSVSGSGWIAISGGDTLTSGDQENDPADLAALALWGKPDGLVFTEPCQWRGTGVNPGPTVDDFATALAALDGFDTSEPTDVTVAGYHGKHVRLVVPDDVDFADCLSGEYRSWQGRYYQGPGQTDDIWILDLDGNRHHFFTAYLPGTTAEKRAELVQMVQSLEIEPIGD
jgi:hypothetical protein